MKTEIERMRLGAVGRWAVNGAARLGRIDDVVFDDRREMAYVGRDIEGRGWVSRTPIYLTPMQSTILNRSGLINELR